ncbi:MAG: hypothetical protein HY681_10500 [Chloroflexi bacterium]|nr:hypothetical protein [Chloroflexota bacterium]
MATMLHSVGETLLDPDTVVLSSTDPTVRLYYKRYHETGVGDKLVCVVVKLSLEDAFVLTAYLTDKAKRGQVLWQRNT